MGISPSTRNRLLIAFALVAIVAVLSLAFRGRSASDPVEEITSGAAPEIRPVEVTTGTAASVNVSAYIQATGSFAADETSDVAPEISGQVVATPVDMGDIVKEGAIIARLDDRDARIRLEQALAAERQAESA
ncbi:MAG TPA: biotin/lipoyl-binding protein, partial [Blastocatellia bacterium]|nr:biotin/lipoyl-binding protein [Blastocatellia bacterium]